METRKSIMPIIGLEKAIFGYIIEKSGYNDTSYRFVFCDEKGTETAFEIEDYLILSVSQHYYSANLSFETKNIIIIDSQNNIITIGGYHFKKKYLQEMTLIGDNGLAICSPTIINEDKFGTNPHFFHPVSYLNLKDSPHIIDLKERIFWKQKYYLFSIMNMHFIVDIENTKFENPDDFTYYLIDEDGNTVYTWDKNNQIKCIWRREDGSFTIFSVSEFDEYSCWDCMCEDYYDNKYYRELILINISSKYVKTTFDDFLQESEERIESNDDDGLLSCRIEKEDYVKWKRRKYINENKTVIKADLLKSLDCRYYSSYYSIRVSDDIDISYSGLFCDNNYFIIDHKYGFCSFDVNKLLATTDLSNIILTENSCYEPRISVCKYRNGLVELFFMEYFVGGPPDRDCSEYNKEIGYRLYDIYGNCTGELQDDILTTPVNGIGIIQYCGVFNKFDFSFILPPIFKEIVPLNRHALYIETKKNANLSDNDFSSEPKKLLSEYEMLGKEYIIIEDKRLYIVTLEIGYGGRTLHGLFENNKELVPVGDNDIKKISGQYVLVKDSSHPLYTLYFHNGRVLLEGVKDVHTINLYNVIIHGGSWQVQESEIAPLVHYAKIYIEKGFMLMVDDKYIIEDSLVEMKSVLYDSNDAYFTAKKHNGKVILLSIKKGVLVSNYEGTNFTDIHSAFNDKTETSQKRKGSYISHIIKNGEEFTDEARHQINDSIWGRTIHPDLYIRYDSKDAALIKLNNSYKIYPRKAIMDFIQNNKEQNLDSSIIVDDVSFIGREEEFEQNDLVLHIETNDGKCGYYSIEKGWLVQPEKVEICDIYDNYVIFNQYIINSRGSLEQFNSLLKLVNKIGQISAYYDSSQNKYVIIDSNGFIYSYLQEIGPGILISNELDSYHEYQIILNTSTKELSFKSNPNYRRHDYYENCSAPGEYYDLSKYSDIAYEGHRRLELGLED